MCNYLALNQKSCDVEACYSIDVSLVVEPKQCFKRIGTLQGLFFAFSYEVERLEIQECLLPMPLLKSLYAYVCWFLAVRGRSWICDYALNAI